MKITHLCFISCLSDGEEDDDDEEEDELFAVAARSKPKPTNGLDSKPSAITPNVGIFKDAIPAAIQLVFMPIYLLAVWRNAELQEMVSVAIHLPSGLISPEFSKVRVSDDQLSLILTVKWPRMISSVNALHKYWNQQDPNALPSFHPRILAFHAAFNMIRDKENDDLFSTATIPLGGQEVLKNIVALTRLGTETGELVLYVDLQRVKSIDYKESPDAAFNIVKDL